MVGDHLKSSQLQQVVDKTMRSVDADEDGKISFEEFCKLVYRKRLEQKMEDLTSTIPQKI